MHVHDDKSEPVNQELDCIVREATLSDFEAINQVKRRNGLKPGSYSDWVRLWDDNPFRCEFQVPLGWVIESRTQGIVGTLSNIQRMYTLNNEPIHVAATRALAVDPQFRFATISLADMFLSQSNIDLFLDTTASPQAGVLFKFLGCNDIPGPSSAQVLFWIVNYTRFAGAMLRKKNMPAFAGIRHAAGQALYLRDLTNLRKGRFQRKEIRLFTSFDERFDAIWNLLRQRSNRLFAVRTSKALTWQFRPALESGDIVILGVMEGDSLSGYLIMSRYDHEQYGLRRFRVVDIQAIDDDSNTVLSLMSAALDHATRSGVDVVEAMGFNKLKRDLLLRLHPHLRTLPSSPYLYRVSAKSSSLQHELQNADAWDPSPFDGDAAL
jgi:hypothetical protein